MRTDRRRRPTAAPISVDTLNRRRDGASFSCHVEAMRRAQALQLLRDNRACLARLGVARLFLYGSVARDHASAESDVDLLIEPGDDRFSLFDLMRVQDACARLLGHPAEVHDYRGLARTRDFRARVSADLVNVF